ncbi:MAG: WbqC family protein [Gammaproteobacteria bacterium]
MIVSIHQPPYLPWLGLLEKIALSDRFVILDNVQYNARAFQHRTLYSCDGGARYLSLAVHSRGHQAKCTKIANITLADSTMPRRHYETLRHRYGRRPGWRMIAAELGEILTSGRDSLLDLNVALLKLTLERFDVRTDLLLASSLGASGRKDELMLELTRAAGGSAYLSGTGAKAYMDESKFSRAQVPVYWQAFEHPIYRQSITGPFQAGCFALEWIIEDPDHAVAGFHAHVKAMGRLCGIIK